jgi:serine/threonine-protein kinase
MDVGIAKYADSKAIMQTLKGFLGTPLYVSPEQIGGSQSVDGRSDVYAFGVVLFEALTGRRPFIGGSVAELFMQHLNAPAPQPSQFATISFPV